MISIDVELLTGRYVAARYDTRTTAEWPPEPARLFSACVATLHEHPNLGQEARAALEWLEALPPPWILASKASARTVSNVFVPVNDVHVIGGWESSFEKLRDAELDLSVAADAKATARAEKALAKAQQKLDQAVRRATEDDGKRGKDPVAIAAQVLPERRGRQPRTFPSVKPDRPGVSFVWPEAVPTEEMRLCLAELVSRIARLGHSSSFVSCRLGDGSLAAERPDDVWIPDRRGRRALRITTQGQLKRLERVFEHHQAEKPRVLPCAFQSYRRGRRRDTSVDPPRTVFGSDWIVFRAVPDGDGMRAPRLRLTRGPDLARALRGALLKHAIDPIPETLSGHDANGTPLERPHVAFVPLADMGSKWASGAILGVAVVLPRDLSADERRAALTAIGRFEASGGDGPCALWMGRAGTLSLERVADLDPRATLQPSTWSHAARRWASVTPIALDRNPGDLRSQDSQKAAAAEAEAEHIVSAACTRIGLPEPAWIQVMRRSVFDAAPKAEAFMPFPRRTGATRRVCVHVEMGFDEPVEGPIVLGAGRYFGLGLLRPRPEEAPWC